MAKVTTMKYREPQTIQEWGLQWCTQMQAAIGLRNEGKMDEFDAEWSRLKAEMDAAIEVLAEEPRP